MRIAEAWESYRARVVPADAVPVQVAECKQAFYAGASSFYFAAVGVTESADGRMSAVGPVSPVELFKECVDFVSDLAGGHV